MNARAEILAALNTLLKDAKSRLAYARRLKATDDIPGLEDLWDGWATLYDAVDDGLLERLHDEQAKYAAGMTTTLDEAAAFHDSDTCPACVNKRNYGHSGFGVIPNLMSTAPRPEPHSDRMAATAEPAPARDFTRDDLVSIADPNHRHYGRHGRIVGYVYDPPGYAVEYDSLGSTLILAPDQLRYEASPEPAGQADTAVPIPAPRNGEQADGGESL